MPPRGPVPGGGFGFLVGAALFAGQGVFLRGVLHGGGAGEFLDQPGRGGGEVARGEVLGQGEEQLRCGRPFVLLDQGQVRDLVQGVGEHPGLLDGERTVGQRLDEWGVAGQLVGLLDPCPGVGVESR